MRHRRSCVVSLFSRSEGAANGISDVRRAAASAACRACGTVDWISAAILQTIAAAGADAPVTVEDGDSSAAAMIR